MVTDDVQESQRASLRHSIADGVPEILGGGLVLVWGLALMAAQTWANEEWPSWLWALASVMGPLLLVAGNGLMRRLKEKLTYPRRGYAKPRPVSPPPRRRVVVVAAALALVAAGGATSPGRLMPFFLGVIVAVYATFEGVRLRLARFIVYAGVALLAGALTAWLFTPGLGVGLLLCSVGTVTVGGGAITLRRLLQIPPEAAA